VTARDREGLIARVRQIRRAAAPQASTASPDAETSPVEALENRVAELEALVQGLQDSVHRESERHARLIADLQAQVKPEAMAAALDRDHRERGL
jgi:hypothetical protein